MTERFLGRCSPEQKRQWEKAARLSRRSLSDWLRIIADDAAEKAIREHEDELKKK
ncbi:MAG: DUF1778 domain-containing protein [Planctomycetaceae bacterium]|nr:DUF1778 domain-containing protein [Planctomycetaceae bacterium]